MFLRKEHVEILRSIAAGMSEREASMISSDSRARVVELYVNGLVVFREGNVVITDAGKTILEAFDGEDLSTYSDVIVDSAVIEALELYELTGIIPEEWLRFLERRNLAQDGKISPVAEKILSAYEMARPALILTNDVVSFLFNAPLTGMYDDLIDLVDLKGYGKNILALLQAMRFLKISPPTGGRSSYVFTPAARMAITAISSSPKVVVHLSIGSEEAEALEAGVALASLVQSGLQEESGAITEYGKKILDVYREMTRRTSRVVPIYVSEDEINTLKAIKEIQQIYKTTPSVIPEYNEIKRRLEKKEIEIENLGEILHLLEMKGLVERFEEGNKQIYVLTDWGRDAIRHGSVSVDAMKAVTYALRGDLPLPVWIERARTEGVIATGITEKGEFYINISRRRPHLMYLTGYDVAVLARTPRNKYVEYDSLISEVMEYLGVGGVEERKRVIRAISEAEAKDLISVLPNGAVSLTERGERFKEIVETAKTRELASTLFAITPLTYSIARVIYENADDINKLWKKSYDKGKDFYSELAKFLANRVRAPVEDVVKALEIMHKVGLMGEKSLTKAGRKLAEVFA